MIAGFKARNHPQQTMFGVDRDVDDRATPLAEFTMFDRRFGGFTIDVAAAEHNRKCDRYFDMAQNGLAQSWAGERVWCNPPYSAIGPWITKAWKEHRATLGIVMLLPANRTEQPWWSDLVEPYRDRPGSPLRSEFLPGRMRFAVAGGVRPPPNSRPPFGSVLLIWECAGPVPSPGEMTQCELHE